LLYLPLFFKGKAAFLLRFVEFSTQTHTSPNKAFTLHSG
jgi:hypothetical protein